MKRSSCLALALAGGLAVLAGVELLATRGARQAHGSNPESSISTHSAESPDEGSLFEDPSGENGNKDGRAPVTTDASSIRPARFLGLVSDTQGRPIAGAHITIRPAESPSVSPPKGLGETGSDGRFTITMEVGSESAFRLRAQAEGFASCEITGRSIVPDRLISIRLGGAFRLHVTLLDAETRAPLPGVETFVGAKRFVSDAAGQVDVPGLACGDAISIGTRFPGYANEGKEVLVTEPGERSVDVELWRATQIEVEVVDGDSGAPLPNVAVRDPLSNSRTDAAGHFKTWATPGHELPVLLSCDEYWRLLWNWTPESVDRSKKIQLPMKRKTWLHGRITDPAGVAVPGAGVDLVCKNADDGRLARKDQERWSPPSLVRYDLTTRPKESPPSDAEGLYRVALPPSASAPAMRVRCAGYVPFELDPFPVTDETASTAFDVVLRRAAAIRGRVISNAKHHALARVTAQDASGRFVGAAGVGPSLTKGPERTYALNGIPEGDILLSLEDAVTQTSIVAVHVEAKAGETLEHDFTWPEETPSELGTISGRVVSAGGTLPPDVQVSAEAVEPTGDRVEPQPVGADGAFTLRLPAGAPHRIVAYTRSPRYTVSEPRVASSGESGVELVLPQIGTVCVRLVDAGTGAPISPQKSEQYDGLRLRRRGDSAWERRSLVVDLDGRSCVELPLGEYDLCVHLGGVGYLPSALEKVSPTLDAEPPARELRLVRGVDAHVRFRGPADRSPIPEGSRVVFLLERSQLASVEGPFAPGNSRADESFGGDQGVHLKIDDDDIRMQRIDREEFYFDGATVKGLRPGHYFVKSFPDDLEFTPSEFEVRGSGRAELLIGWRPK